MSLLVLVVIAVLCISPMQTPAFAFDDEVVPEQPAAEQPAVPPSPGTDVNIPYGRTVDLDGGALQVTFVSVQEDSRCPMEVMCVWQGRAVTVFRATVDGVDQGEINLVLLGLTATRSGNTTAVGQYTLRLDTLEPYPKASQRTPPEQYVATLHVTQ